MNSLILYFGCGKIYSKLDKQSKQKVGLEYTVSKFSDLEEIIIPFFNKYPILGVKSKDFADFCKAFKLVKNKEHLNLKGLQKIRLIKNGMNTGRKL